MTAIIEFIEAHPIARFYLLLYLVLFVFFWFFSILASHFGASRRSPQVKKKYT